MYDNIFVIINENIIYPRILNAMYPHAHFYVCSLYDIEADNCYVSNGDKLFE